MKYYKSIFVFLLLLTSWSFIFCSNVVLNQYGHIQDPNISETGVEYFLQDTDYHLKIDGNVLKGNTVYPIKNGYLTLTTLEENVSSYLRIYSNSGILVYEEDFRRIVNIRISENREYSAFYCENNILSLDHESLQLNEFQGMNVFDIDNSGNIISYDEETGGLLFGQHVLAFKKMPRKILYCNGSSYIFTSGKVYGLENDELELISELSGKFFEAKIINDALYYVTKNNTRENIEFSLYHLSESGNELLDEVEIHRELTREHDPIPSPLNYGEEYYPFHIGNSYAALQEYGQALYMHPGVDFLGDDYQEVYAVKDGFVKAVITTGGAAYWRIAIANENTPDEVDGYLYAHLNENSITVAVGDTVYTGDLLGTLFDWTVAEFTHIHFARLSHAGEVWDGAWWTIDSPQIDFTNVCDTIPPQFELTQGDNYFAFRNEAGEYLDDGALTGEFDIISKCRDYCNSPWAQGPYDMWFTVASAFSPDVILYEHPHLGWDMPTDVYNFGQYSFMCVNTFYSRDAELFSTVGYDYIEAYHLVTNVDENPEITAEDALQMFDSAQFADGLYMIYVHARDQSLNESEASMLVTFSNGVGSDETEIPEITDIALNNYPNPFNPCTRFSFELPEAGSVLLSIYNSNGQKVIDLVDGILDSGEFIFDWNGEDELGALQSSGVYLYKLHYKNKQYTKKMIMIK